MHEDHEVYLNETLDETGRQVPVICESNSRLSWPTSKRSHCIRLQKG
jgi:hypothetical protein